MCSSFLKIPSLMLERGRTGQLKKGSMWRGIIGEDGELKYGAVKKLFASPLLRFTHLDGCRRLLVERSSCSCHFLKTSTGFVLLICASAAHLGWLLPKLWLQMCRKNSWKKAFVLFFLHRYAECRHPRLHAQSLEVYNFIRKQEKIMRTDNNMKWATCAVY